MRRSRNSSARRQPLHFLYQKLVYFTAKTPIFSCTDYGRVGAILQFRDAAGRICLERRFTEADSAMRAVGRLRRYAAARCPETSGPQRFAASGTWNLKKADDRRYNDRHHHDAESESQHEDIGEHRHQGAGNQKKCRQSTSKLAASPAQVLLDGQALSTCTASTSS
jgi:hypothetical protein